MYACNSEVLSSFQVSVYTRVYTPVQYLQSHNTTVFIIIHICQLLVACTEPNMDLWLKYMYHITYIVVFTGVT